MRTLVPGLLLLCILNVTAEEMAVKAVPVRPAQKTSLFNGKDFAWWTKVVTAEPGSDPDVTWTVADGVIRCTCLLYTSPSPRD